ncbi:hypothetical protein ACFL29_00590 [Patescibacteria group bacterium]
MKIDAYRAIVTIVDLLMTEPDKDKVLHICLNASYLCFPHAEEDGSNVSDEINKNTFVHFVFYRPRSTYIMVLRHEGSRFLKEDDVFTRTSYHDSCWVDAVRSALTSVHWRILEEIAEEYKKITGKEMSRLEKLKQPNFVCIRREVEVHEGEVVGVNTEKRDCKLELADNKMRFVVIDE